MTRFHCRRALVAGRGWVDDVLVDVEAGRVTRIDDGAAEDDAIRLPGLTIPGLANCHSHAFHRALRGRVQRDRGTFWTWRDTMYTVAEHLDPESYFELARAVYAEMVSVGITAVGEFHYLHHGPGGQPYDDPNEMGHALVAAARDAGLRITLLDTCYLAAGFGRGPEGVQTRFSDGDATRWAERVETLHQRYADAGDVVVGAAVHSVRAVPAAQLPVVAGWAAGHGAPLHVHLSEQPAENADCVAARGVTPTVLLAEHGVLTPRTSAVHATHLTDADVGHLGAAGTYACFCPTTERDLADGVGPARALGDAGSPLTLGSDSHAVIDLFEEMRAVELNERLVSRVRGTWAAGELLTAATADGQRSLGFDDAGAIQVGAPGDLVAVADRSWRTAGTGGADETVVFAASGADVTDVVVGGEHVVNGRTYARHPDLAASLAVLVERLVGA